MHKLSSGARGHAFGLRLHLCSYFVRAAKGHKLVRLIPSLIERFLIISVSLPANSGRVVQIGAGSYHTVALTGDF